MCFSYELNSRVLCSFYHRAAQWLRDMQFHFKGTISFNLQIVFLGNEHSSVAITLQTFQN